MPHPPPPSYDTGSGYHRIAKEPRRKVARWIWGMLALVFILAFVVVYALAGDDSDATPAIVVPKTTSVAVPTITTPANAAAPSADLPEGAVSGEGTYEVGVDIAPGKYKTAGPSDPNTAGYWARRPLDPASQATEITQNGTSKGPVTIVVKKGELFESRGFKPWHKV